MARTRDPIRAAAASVRRRRRKDARALAALDRVIALHKRRRALEADLSKPGRLGQLVADKIAKLDAEIAEAQAESDRLNPHLKMPE